MNNNISNAERIAENSLPGMARMVKLEVVIEGMLIRHFKYFALDQSARRHHRFEITLPHNALEHAQNHHLNEARKFLGRQITITFIYKDAENESPERAQHPFGKLFFGV